MPRVLKIIDRMRIYEPYNLKSKALESTSQMLFGPKKVYISDTAFVMSYNDHDKLALKLWGVNQYLLLEEIDDKVRDAEWEWEEFYIMVATASCAQARAMAEEVLHPHERDMAPLIRKHVGVAPQLVGKELPIGPDTESPGKKVTLW